MEQIGSHTSPGQALVSVRSLSHVGLTVTDIDRSTAFYRDILGFKIRFEFRAETWCRVGLSVDEVLLELFSPFPGGDRPLSDHMMYPGPYGRPKIALTVTDVERAYEALLAAGQDVVGPVCETPVSKLIFLRDPDGTWIQLHQFGGGQLRVRDVLRHPDELDSP